jgi:hypothetical protein
LYSVAVLKACFSKHFSTTSDEEVPNEATHDKA